MRERWPRISDAFARFRVREVAGWPDAEAERLTAAPGIIRNRKKITATLRNARELVALAGRHGSVRAYLESFRGDTDALVADIDRWAHYIGPPSIRWFLGCCRLGSPPRRTG